MVFPFLITLLVVALIALPVWMIVKILGFGTKNEHLEARVDLLERELSDLRDKVRTAAAQPTPTRVATPAAPAVTPTPPPVPKPAAVLPPPLAAAAASPVASISSKPASSPVTPPPITRQPPPLVPPAPVPEPVASRINWEQFMGAKLFAWLGGLALFLGVAFGVKYSFEHDLIPPEVRVAAGFLLGAGLIVGGLKLSQRYAITAQTLCATGVVSLYAVTFACNSIYHFAFFGPLATFALMTLITATAFMLAVRMEARVVAVLGMLGGFLTPVLLSTGHDNPPGLFGYLALLDIGLVAVALHRRWHFLVPLGAAGTVIMQIGWVEKFFAVEKAPIAMVVCLGFCALFLAAYAVARRLGQFARELTWPAIAMPFVSFGFALFFLSYPGVAQRAVPLFTFVLLADAALLALAWLDEDLDKLPTIAGASVFVVLAAWTAAHLTPALMPAALAFYLFYAVAHTGFPLLLRRHRPETGSSVWGQLFPPLTLLLMLGPLFKLEAVSLLLWPCILLVDLLAIGLAVISASLTAVVAVLVLTLAATGLWIFNVPVTVGAPFSLLLVLGAFALIFFGAGIFLARRLAPSLGAASSKRDDDFSRVFGDARAQIPAFSALLPFVLLIMMTQRLALADPSPVFGLALLLAVLTLGLTFVLTVEWLPACALAGVLALEYSWHARLFTADRATTPLAWYVGFHALFAAYPFLFRRKFLPLTGPWAIAALSGVGTFPLVYRAVSIAWPNDVLGLLPAVFAVPPLLSLVAQLRTPDGRARLNQLAWYGGTALFFITLIFPIQFERQWITLGWALEGAALLWLFHRVPHPGLRATGAVLLVVAFARLALNPAVLEYHARAAAPIFNWYLYSYATVVACLLVGARLLAPPHERIFGLNVPPLLNALAIALAFLLLNIEIADYFSEPGRRVLTFQFSGNFARDMSYTIAWALFGFGLLLLGFWKKSLAGRYAAGALLLIVLLKLFLHDLANLAQLYRIAALFAVAVIAILASFAYQRFLPSGHEKPAPSK
jgi:uncharacterized membrane protein